MIWDLRSGKKPAQVVVDLHDSDINTVDWSGTDLNLIATGSNDMSVKVTDIRTCKVAHTLLKHKSKV